MRVYLSTLFKKAGYEVEAAQNGDEGVAARMPLARAARSWSCMSAISGEMTTHVRNNFV